VAFMRALRAPDLHRMRACRRKSQSQENALVIDPPKKTRPPSRRDSLPLSLEKMPQPLRLARTFETAPPCRQPSRSSSPRSDGRR
jgi:hypothetical protein